jgi:amino acid permease
VRTTREKQRWHSVPYIMSSSSEQHNHDRHQQGQPYCCFDPEHELTRDASSFTDIVNLPSYESMTSARHHHNVPAAPANTGGGSSVAAAVFNFTNCIVGAGAIGLGGAMAASGGIISCLTIILVAVLVKVSLDLLIQLSVSTNNNTYEDLGYAAFGSPGKLLVMASKFAYAFGCLVAYTVVIQDNLGPALRNLLYTSESNDIFYWLLEHDVWCTWVVSLCVILPLCLLRDMTGLASASVVSNVAMVAIVAIVIHLWWIDIDHSNRIPDDNNHNATSYIVAETTVDSVWTTNNSTSATTASDLYKHWFEIRWIGFFSNVGTFVFTFVCQHTVHLAYGSLKPEIRNVQTWKRVSTASLTAACSVSLSVGVFCYMTFWERTVSDIFKIYPDSIVIDLAKLLLCITMLLTFPLPFFTCRELLIVFLCPVATPQSRDGSERGALEDLEEPLLPQSEDEGGVLVDSTTDEHMIADTENGVNERAYTSLASPDQLRRSVSVNSAALSLDISVMSTIVIEAMNSILLPGEERQLKLPYHVGLTCKLWFIVTGLAIAAPNLGDVLDLVGCASGTLIAFILPGWFAMRMQGYSHVAALILVVGGLVGTVGTICSLKQFVRDTFGSS